MELAQAAVQNSLKIFDQLISDLHDLKLVGLFQLLNFLWQFVDKIIIILHHKLTADVDVQNCQVAFLLNFLDFLLLLALGLA